MNLCTKSLTHVELTFDLSSNRLISAIADNVQNLDSHFRSRFREINNQCTNCVVQSKRVFDQYVLHCKQQIAVEIVPQLAQIFSSVNCNILPICEIHMNGTVSLCIDDCSHLAQLDQFIISRCFGGLASFVEENLSAEFFDRRVVIGINRGSNPQDFKRKVECFLDRIWDQIPVLRAGVCSLRDRSGPAEFRTDYHLSASGCGDV